MKLNAKLATENKAEQVFKMKIVAPRLSAVWWKLPKIPLQIQILNYSAAIYPV